MNNILLISQDKKVTGFVRFIGVGRRQPDVLIGDKLKSLLEEKNMTVEDLIKKIGNSYKERIERIIENEEIPSKKHIELITKALEIDNDYFEDKELENVLVTDNNIIVAKYDNNDKALEVKKKIDEYILECYRNDKPIIIELD